jgi:hypothetical protein
MPSTYTLNNGIELIGTGEQSGTWGDTTNTNLGLLDAALDGQVTITLAAAGSSGSPNALPITDGTTSNGRNRMVVFADGGDLGATAYVQLTPNDAEKIIYIRNSLSGSRSVILFQGTYNASNDYEVPAGTTAVVYFDGAGAGAVAANVFNNAYFDGLRLGSVSVTAILDEDNMASDSATALATQQSIKAYVDSQVGTVDTLAEILAIGNTTGATDIAVDSAQKVQFRDAAIYINSSVDGQLDIVADTEIQIAATTVDLNGNLDVSGTTLVTGVLTTTAATVFNGGFASNADSTLGTDKKVQFRDAAIYINSSVDGQLDIVADTEIQIAATTVDLNGALDVSGTLGVTGVLTATSLDISGDIDVDGTTNLDVVDIDGATQIDATVTVGVDDTGYDVKFFGATTGKSLLWDESADSLIVTGTTTLVGTTNLDVVDIDGATQIDATVTVGVDDTGYDVKFFGATAGAYMLWDESADDLILGGAAGLSVNSTALVTGVLTTTAATVSNGGGQFNGAINVGVDDTGYDVKFFGATTGKSLLWDESADSLTVAGNLTVDGGTIKLDGNYPVGTGNVALGNTALDSNVSGEYNTAIGDVSLTSNTTGISNVSVGAFSMENNIDGNYNTSVGVLGLRLNESGLYNTAIGYAALLNNTSSSNTAVGYQALLDNLGGFSLVGVGATALQNNTTGYDNVAVGVNSLNLNTSGINNTAMGSYALSSTITTSNSTAVGYRSLLNATGTNSNAFGYEAGLNVSTAQYGTYIGSRSASAGAAVITGDANTMIGEGAGYVLQGGANSNTFLGQGSGSYVTTGSANTILGRYNGNQGGLDLRTSSNNIVLSDGDGNPRAHFNANGNLAIGASLLNATSSEALKVYGYVDGASQYGIFIAGNANGYTQKAIRFYDTYSPSVVGEITFNSSSTTYATSSDYRLKENVVYDWDATTRLKQLKPARFNFIVDADTTVDGFLAHEAQAVVPECVTGTKDAVDADGVAVMQGIDQSKLVPLLVKTIQELEARITALEGA